MHGETLLLAPAAKRARDAHALLDRIKDYSQAPDLPRNLHMAWLMLNKSVAHAHTYDARLIPSEPLSAI
eukprot:1357416-Karenia_brevis.AAC.1